MSDILVAFGTRPEAIKMAPLIHRISDFHRVTTCVTAQHREMLDQVLEIFSLEANYDLDLMRPEQTLSELSARVLKGFSNILAHEKPSIVLVHGDTTTTLCVALACFYARIPVGHVEAGLRTYDMESPFPEEMNRQVVSKISRYHFAPTELAKENLTQEGVKPENIAVTGNTVIDALFSITKRMAESPIRPNSDSLRNVLKNTENKQIMLVTCHRRENFGEGFESICQALLEISQLFADLHIVFPVHRNPNVRRPVEAYLSNKLNIHLIEPLEYLDFVILMKKSHLVLTDSGGIQEEAPSLGIPVLVARNTTERPEALDAGTVKLVGSEKKAIVTEVRALLEKRHLYEVMSRAHNPYGDGNASERILDFLNRKLLD